MMNKDAKKVVQKPEAIESADNANEPSNSKNSQFDPSRLQLTQVGKQAFANILQAPGKSNGCCLDGH